VYGVVPPLFGTRPLHDVAGRLDALADLGVDVLWLAPIMATDDPGEISYATTDYQRIRPDYGTPDDLRELVRGAHARRMRVILDIVPNHTSTGHAFYRDAEARGPSSPYWRYYVRDAHGEAAHDFDWLNLRKLDYANPAVRQMITAAFEYWIREFDVDGFRVDAAWGVRDRAPDFWPALVADLRRLKPGVILVAEASARDPYYVASGFDAAYDWTEDLGHWSWDTLFDDPRHIGPALDGALSSGATPMDRVFRFIDNNDTGERFITRHGAALTRVAAVLLHTLPGLAEVFTGDEVGAAYQPYQDPPPIDWSRDPEGLRTLYRRLATLREQLPALRDGAYGRVRVAGTDSAFAFLRDAGGGEQALVVLNFGAARRLRLELPTGLVRPPSWDALADRAVEARAAGQRALELDLGADTAVILVPRP
jgi:glycosidase